MSCTHLDEHHEGAGKEGHVDEGAEGDHPPQRRALGQQRLRVCVWLLVGVGWCWCMEWTQSRVESR